MRKLIHSVAAMLAGAALFAALSYAAAPKNLDRAIEVQRALVAERPADSTAENDLGNLLVLADEMEGAEQAYRRAIELDPENASAHFNLALLLQQQGERKEALKQFKRTLELDPRHAWAQYQIGTIHHAQGSDSAAKKAYAKALALDPQLGNPKVNPHLIDNDLATSAMLYAYHHYREELLPAKEFEEPARIAGVLIDLPAGATGDQTANGGEGGFVRGPGTPEPAGDASGATVQSEKPEPMDDEVAAGAESRTLSTKDLDPSGAANQISGGGVPARAGAAGRATGGQITSGNRGRTRDAQPAPARPTLRGPSSGGSTSQPAAPPTTFQPTGDSTGMMEVRLVEIDEWS